MARVRSHAGGGLSGMRFSPSKSWFIRPKALALGAGLLLVLACGWVLGQPDAAPELLRLGPGQERVPVSSFLRMLEDPGGQLSIEDVASPKYAAQFQRLRGEGVRSGLTEPTVYWLRLTYASQPDNPNPEAYYFDLGQMTKVSGTIYAAERLPSGGLAWRERPALTRAGQPTSQTQQFSQFPLPLPNPEPRTVFLRLKVPLDLEAMPELATRTGLQQRLLEQTLFSGALLGIFAVLIINNLIIFFTLRYAGYLWYALLLLTFSLQVALINGLLQEFAPQSWVNPLVGLPVVALGLVAVVRILFVRSFLPLKEYFPRGDRLLVVILLSFLVLVVWPFLEGASLLVLKFYAAISIPSVLVVAQAGIVCWRKGYGPARFFLLGYLAEIVGSLIMVTGYFGFWSPLPITTFHVQQIGITVEAMLLSLALVQRVNVLRQERQQLEQAAQHEAQEHQKRLRGLVGELVRSEERQRKALADDLHDGISQNLATSLFNLRLLGSNPASPDLPGRLAGICGLLGQTLRETRTLTFDISPPVLHDFGLEAGLEWLAERFAERHGLAVRFSAETALPSRDESLEVNLFRAAQELLVNAVKHAKATRVEMVLAREGSQILLRVSDNGKGMANGQLARQGRRGFGLFSIRERLEALGGGLEIISRPGLGSTVVLSAPWPQAPGREAQEA